MRKKLKRTEQEESDSVYVEHPVYYCTNVNKNQLILLIKRRNNKKLASTFSIRVRELETQYVVRSTLAAFVVLLDACYQRGRWGGLFVNSTVCSSYELRASIPRRINDRKFAYRCPRLRLSLCLQSWCLIVFQKRCKLIQSRTKI